MIKKGLKYFLIFLLMLFLVSCNNLEGGKVINKIEKTETIGLKDKYTIYYEDGSTYSFIITNGKDGIDGIQGEQGQDGHTPEITIGDNGNWYIDGVDTNIRAEAINPPHYGETFNVCFYPDGGILPQNYSTQKKVNWGDTIDLPIPTKEGFVFKGWYTGDTINDKKFTSYDAVFKDLNLYAKYEGSKYNITLDLNGGSYSGDTTIEVEAEGLYKLPKNVTKNNLVFAGWYLEDVRLNFEGKYTFKKNINVKAKWVEKETYNITLDLNGGTLLSIEKLNITNQDIYNGYKFELPSKNGYEFFSYNFKNKILVDENGLFNVDYAISILSKNKNCTLTAKYISDDLNKLGDYLYFGKYPQDKVDDEYLIDELKMAKDIDNDGYLEYEDKEYKLETNEFANTYTYFIVEPILWSVNSNAFLFSQYILDSSKFYNDRRERRIDGEVIYGNNDKYSTIRAFLNGYDGSKYKVDDYTDRGFYNIAFDNEEKKIIKKSNIDDNHNFLWLLSKKDIQDDIYDFNLSDRDYCQKQSTDYASFKGVLVGENGNSSWWLRSSKTYGSNVAYYVDYSGDVSGTTFYELNYGVVPIIELLRKTNSIIN